MTNPTDGFCVAVRYFATLKGQLDTFGYVVSRGDQEVVVDAAKAMTRHAALIRQKMTDVAYSDEYGPYLDAAMAVLDAVDALASETQGGFPTASANSLILAWADWFQAAAETPAVAECLAAPD